MSISRDTDLMVDFNERMVRINHVVREIQEPSNAETVFRELLGACHKLVPKFKRGHALFNRIVPDAQLPLWKDFARQNGEAK